MQIVKKCSGTLCRTAAATKEDVLENNLDIAMELNLTNI